MAVFKDKRFCSDVFQFINQYKLLLPQKRYLLAVSGGLDSMVLLHFFQRFAHKRYDCEFAVAHLDHGLREESLLQATELADYCESQGLLFLSARRIPLRSNAQSSLEAQARTTRYSWLSELMQTHAFDSVFTAHHATDQLETSLMQWIRGVAAPQGMRPLSRLQYEDRSFWLARPFLAVSRADLERYHAYYQLPCWEDASNQDLDFMRNRLRHQVLPLLISENPNLEATITEHAVVIQQEQSYLRDCMLNHYHECVRNVELNNQNEMGYILDLESFTVLHVAIQRLIFKEILTRLLNGSWKSFNVRHIEALYRLTSAQSHKTLQLPLAVSVSKQKKSLFFVRRNNQA